MSGILTTGTATIGTGLYLPTLGGTPSRLKYYEESVSLSTTFQAQGGGGTTTTVTQYLTRIGNMCFLFCPTIQINGLMRLYKSNSSPDFGVGVDSGTAESATFIWMIK